MEPQISKNEYTRSQLLKLRHEGKVDLIEKAKNLKIAERIIQKNAAAKNMAATTKGGTTNENSKDLSNFADEFWSKATTTEAPPSNQNAANHNDDDDKFGFVADFTFRSSNAKVDNWLNAGRGEMPTQFSQCDDFNFNDSFSNSQTGGFVASKPIDTSSMVSDMSIKSSRSKLLDKTAKLKETLNNLKQKKN